MACYKPLSAFQYWDGGALMFNRPYNKPARSLEVPCGQCIGCRLDKTLDWQTRIMHEAALHDHNHFTTMTYSDENLPANRGLPYRDVQLFRKRLRKALGGKPIRFLNVGEYGEQTSRAHWHEILFGVELPDMYEEGKGSQGDPLYRSDILEKAWGKGMVKIGEVNETTAQYVAGYALKDTKAKEPGAYDAIDPATGELHQREQPRMRVSRNPGLGAEFYKLFPDDCRKGFLTRKGRTVPLPKYYLRKMEDHDPMTHSKLKADREAAVNTPEHKRENTPERRAVREEVKRLEQARIRAMRRGNPLEGAAVRTGSIDGAIMALMTERQANPGVKALTNGITPTFLESIGARSRDTET